MWKIEDSLFDFVSLCTRVLVDKPLFVLINSYTTGLQPAVISNILSLTMKDFEGDITSYEVGIATEEGIPLPCGASGLFVGKR
jgi:23S rRNA (cytosine1962-C5)-methyltransferase